MENDRKKEISKYINRHKEIIKLTTSAKNYLNINFVMYRQDYIIENEQAIIILQEMINDLEYAVNCSCESYFRRLLKNVDEKFKYIEEQIKKQNNLI